MEMPALAFFEQEGGPFSAGSAIGSVAHWHQSASREQPATFLMNTASEGGGEGGGAFTSSNFATKPARSH